MKLSRADADDRMFQGVSAHAPMNAITYDPLRRSIYYCFLLAGLLRTLSIITYCWERGIQIVRGGDTIGGDVRPELRQSERQAAERSASSGTTRPRPAAENRQRVPNLLAVQI